MLRVLLGYSNYRSMNSYLTMIPAFCGILMLSFDRTDSLFALGRRSIIDKTSKK